VTTRISEGVVLARGETGSVFFHGILSETVRQFPSLSSAALPSSAAQFKKNYGVAIARFESARIASPQRVDIAAFLRRATLASLQFSAGQADVSLLDALSRTVAAPPTVTFEPTLSQPGLTAEVPCDGRMFRGKAVLDLVSQLHAEHHLTDAAAAGLKWVVEFIEAQGGALPLLGQRFALLGASAELSPVSLLLQAGATVRWIDTKKPPSNPGAGRLISTQGGDDLLTNPQAVAAALREFAQEGPVHLGLFAYAPGSSRELRLAGAMDALVETLGPTVVKSVSLYVSPTSPGELQAEDLKVSASRKRSPKLWQRGLQATRILKSPGHIGSNEAAIAQGVISLQGAAYQAAQYLTKIISTEVLATQGLGGKRITVSANVAGITNTRSLAHPLFQAAFRGAPQFGVRVFEPETTRALSGLLMLHDVLNPEAPGSATRQYVNPIDRARALRTQQIHGGVYDLPWQFDSAVKTAAVLGLGKRPDLLLRRSP
jgi:hypothetical protein